MKRTGRLHKRLLCMMLAVLLGIGLAFTGYVPAVEAAEGTREMANLVIFVKMQGAEGNVFDEIVDHGTYKDDNWKTIKDMYDNGLALGSNNNSFSSYIRTITCGKVTVTNIFPQIYTRDDGTEGIGVLELSRVQYDMEDSMAQEVIKKIGEANPGDPLYGVADQFLDRDGDGCVDNLTIIVQGDTINGKDHSFKRDYSGDDTIYGLRVRCYNAMPSKMLLDSLGTGTSLISHEFLHTLGLPDLYSSAGGSSVVASGPVGIWDVMASTGATVPRYLLGYLRAEKGWLEGSQVQEITSGGTYTLTAVSEPDDRGGIRLITIKTPLSQSESETICLEYRKPRASGEYDHFPSQENDGLLMYRVDDKVPNHTNYNGGNYIYVYRPGCQKANDCDVTTYGAPVTVAEGSYGSTDLNADYSANTLHFSDGSNSGIRISNVRQQDETSITFDVEFAEYSDNWQALGGGAAANDVMGSELYADSDGNLYLSYVDTSNQVHVLKWDETSDAWNQMGGALSSCRMPSTAMASCNGKLYLAYLDSSSYPVYSVWNGSSWSGATRLGTVSYPESLQLMVDGNEIYVAYTNSLNYDSKQLIIQNLLNETVVVNNRTARDFGNPTIVKQGDLFYLAYGTYPNSKIDTYDIVTKAWSTVYDYEAYGNLNLLHRQGTKLYGFSGNPGSVPSLTVWDGSTWTRTAVSQMSSFLNVSLVTAGETVYLAYLDSSAKQAKLLRLSGNSFVSCYDGLNGYAEDLQAAAIGDQVYVATRTGNSVTVRRQKVEYVPSAPSPSLPALTISLTPPAGYNNADVYIDGIKYTATKSGSSYTLQLPDKTGKTAVMYYYNEQNVPKGMYVWRLSYQGDTCTATPLPGLQDLLSYHGFSIRVQGYSGLRFKSGIDTQKRAQLLGDGVNGYRLTEYGTLLITGSNLQRYPFIKDGEKVGGGRSYWVENGVVNDRIFETVDGRYRFASVVTKLPQQQYATELAFRAYAVLQSADGEQLIIYGPPVARSIYTVAKQVLAAGEFKKGSSGYNYVKSIVDAVEGR